jgi:outer membrane protein OmpA-like peptidoglycan-associated protein
MKNLSIFLYVVSFLFASICITAQNGLLAEYFDGTNFNHKVATRIDDKIDMYWNNRPPVDGIDPHECSIRWTGRLQSPKTGTYTFSARVDDGIRVWVGGVKVIDDWGLNDVGIFSGEVKMEAGKMYDLKVEYFNALVEGEITLLWEIPKEEETNWLNRWLSEARPVVIESEYFYQPVLLQPLINKSSEVAEKPKPVANPKPAVKPTLAPEKEMATVETIQKYTPENIQFERAKADILSESFPDLNELADFLNRHTHLKVTIEGHTDYVGDAYKNVILSQDRADAVAAYLIEKGVAEDRLEAKGYGGSRPLAKSDGRKYHPENRRVAFIIE